MTPLEQAIAEQRACRAYLDGPGEDRDGAWAGMKDWLLEECVIRLETNYMPFKKMRELPVPLMCAVRNQTDQTESSLACHESIVCQRCGNCLHHCECFASVKAPVPVKKLRRGKVHESQLQLCEKPELRTTRF